MVLVALQGRIELSAELLSGETFSFLLDKPTQGLYLPPLCWHVMAYSPDAVQLVLASTEYDLADYIRIYRSVSTFGPEIKFFKNNSPLAAFPGSASFYERLTLDVQPGCGYVRQNRNKLLPRFGIQAPKQTTNANQIKSIQHTP